MVPWFVTMGQRGHPTDIYTSPINQCQPPSGSTYQLFTPFWKMLAFLLEGELKVSGCSDESPPRTGGR